MQVCHNNAPTSKYHFYIIYFFIDNDKIPGVEQLSVRRETTGHVKDMGITIIQHQEV